MNAPNSHDDDKEARRRQQTQRKIQKDIRALFRAAAKQKDGDVKRRILDRILLLDPANSSARDMLLELDQAEIRRYQSMGKPYQSGTTSASTPATLDAREESQK